jgi:hypothetical protein
MLQAYGSMGSYGQARFYRVEDMNCLLVEHGKAVKPKPVKFAPKARGKVYRLSAAGWKA